MAIVYATKTGNWSDTTVWNTGALPTSSDDVYSNTFTVTIDTSPTVLSIRNTSTTGVTQGGSFVPTNGITVTCTGTGIVAGNVSCIVSTLIIGQSFTIASNAFGGTASNASGISNNSSGTITITGIITGGASVQSFGVINSSSGTLYITGTVYGSVNYSSAYGVGNISSGIIYLTGDMYGNSGTGSAAFANTGLGNSVISGNAIAGTSPNNPAGIVVTNGTVMHTGTVQASTTFPGIYSTGGSLILSGPFLTSSNGINPVIATRWFWANSTPPATRYEIRTQNLATIRPLYTADSVGGNPAASNVRSGTVFGPASELTGTMRVPPAGSVNFGVPVDNTTGTALVTASSVINAIWNYPISGITTSGSIGERLKNTATVDAVNTILSNGLR